MMLAKCYEKKMPSETEEWVFGTCIFQKKTWAKANSIYRDQDVISISL